MAGRILIADNIATNRITLKVKLSAASYAVSQASNGRELLQQAVLSPPDLILMDGGLDGDRTLDLVHDLKRSPATQAIPVLILCSDYTAADRLAALMSGAADILNKPVGDNELLARVRNAQRVRAIDEEIRLREGTAQELGFQEGTTRFDVPAQILLVDVAADTCLGWQQSLGKNTQFKTRHVGRDDVLNFLAKAPLKPDVIVLNPGQITHRSDLFLLAELRNRPATRHAEILVLHSGEPSNEHAMPSALDLGASEVMSRHVPPGELAFRVKRLLRRKQKADTLRGTVEQGLRMAVTDPLTGLFNRRYALPHMARIAEKSRASGNPFAVMVLDLDFFKQINDTHGHRAGDLVLTEVARRLKANVRSVDLIARIGGEEFLVVMPETDLDSARLAAERLRHVTQADHIAVAGIAAKISVTASIGVSIAGKKNAPIPAMETVVERADQALMGAKTTGRNQVICEISAA